MGEGGRANESSGTGPRGDLGQRCAMGTGDVEGGRTKEISGMGPRGDLGQRCTLGTGGVETPRKRKRKTPPLQFASSWAPANPMLNPRILTPPGHSPQRRLHPSWALANFHRSFFLDFFFQKKMQMQICIPSGHLHSFLGGMPDIWCWLYSELYLGRFQTDGLKNRTLIAKVFV